MEAEHEGAVEQDAPTSEIKDSGEEAVKDAPVNETRSCFLHGYYTDNECPGCIVPSNPTDAEQRVDSGGEE